MLLLLLLLSFGLLLLSLHVLLFPKCRYASVRGGKPNTFTFRCENKKPTLNFHSQISLPSNQENYHKFSFKVSPHVYNQNQINIRTNKICSNLYENFMYNTAVELLVIMIVVCLLVCLL